ncbi:uncharacterized protein ARMOST_01552 [Armillaria ostoyae]|uniref:Uncharacterized protein n=1 Tax=Armillaria ostoyae TaxID=47428 RepID=A0A284QP73_ARMOS|nr:uncharacterized protein ARMOST_01552 [Armillaria ostoyae]
MRLFAAEYSGQTGFASPRNPVDAVSVTMQRFLQHYQALRSWTCLKAFRRYDKLRVEQLMCVPSVEIKKRYYGDEKMDFYYHTP